MDKSACQPEQSLLAGLAHLSNLMPYQRRAQHAGHGGVEVEGGRLPTRDSLLNLLIFIQSWVGRPSYHSPQ
jgi:hypothetical protein